jgi:hypothetical protein
MQEHSLAHTKQVDPLFTVVLAIINPFDREWIAQRLRALLEGHAVAAPVFCGRVISFERVIVHLGTGDQYYFQESSLRMATFAAHLEGPRRAALDGLADKGRKTVRDVERPGRSRPLARRSLDRSESIQGVFGISNDTVPIINQHLFIDIDPLPQKLQIVRIEPASYYPDCGSESDSDHLGRSDPRSAGDFDPDIVPRSASLRNEHNEREPSALGPQISHFVRGLAFRLGIGTTGSR